MNAILDNEIILAHLSSLWSQATEIWASGGWAMYAIAAIALILFGLGMQIHLKFSGKGFASIQEKTWRKWIDHPEKRKGPIGDMINFVSSGSSLKDTTTFFEELHGTEVAPFDRDLRVMKICVTAAPLLGLLGTVTGMLTTFSALASGSGGEKTMALVAGGISEALVTTETGLVIALTGLFFQYHLARKHERYKAFLAHLETVCTQREYTRLRKQGASGSKVHVSAQAPAKGKPRTAAPVSQWEPAYRGAGDAQATLQPAGN